MALALGITLFIKVPQEMWIHVLQLDVTDAIAAHPELIGVIVAFLIVVVVALVQVVRRSPEPDWSFTMAVAGTWTTARAWT